MANGVGRENLPGIFTNWLTLSHGWIMRTASYYLRWPRKLQSVGMGVSFIAESVTPANDPPLGTRLE